MGSPEGFSGGGDYAAEVRRDPEVDGLLEFLGVYGKIQEIMSWLVEASANADFTVKAVRRGHLQKLMQQLGLDPESPDSFTQLEDMKTGLTDRTLHPKPRIEVPEVGFFKSRIKELITEQQRYGNPTAFDYAVEGRADLAGVARYGHTDWANVQSRAGEKHISEWIHGVARIMADPVAYHAEFAGLGIDSGHRAADHLEIAEDWSIQNGRHRSLATRSLGEEYVLEAGMAQWIPVSVEQA
ncbi:hypothetical protein HY003_02770 [Candidatus Saccharibacteria bacterium]|nr:hypothetical protein [Candidatus Saccharibacteria bacterium]MBI3338197.1 hypothetical protein [Candidatus Saccharibacteria bacterium]